MVKNPEITTAEKHDIIRVWFTYEESALAKLHLSMDTIKVL